MLIDMADFRIQLHFGTAALFRRYWTLYFCLKEQWNTKSEHFNIKLINTDEDQPLNRYLRRRVVMSLDHRIGIGLSSSIVFIRYKWLCDLSCPHRISVSPLLSSLYWITALRVGLLVYPSGYSRIRRDLWLDLAKDASSRACKCVRAVARRWTGW